MWNQRRGWMMVGVLLLLAGPALAWEIPLTIEEQGGKGGIRYVTCGVPLLVGQAREPSELRLAVKDAGGRLKAVPAQFRVLARWWRADNSIRWVLLDLATGVEPSQKKTFYLTNARLAVPKPKDALTVEEAADAVVVTTGPARFAVSRKKFTFLQHAYIDDNKDGRFAEDEDLLATTADCGTVLEGTDGTRYYSSEDTKSVEVIEAGPLRVQVRARGMHRAREGKGYSKGMYSYDVLLNFYAGGTDVYVDPIIGNNPPKSTGSPTFEDGSLTLKLAGGATGCRLYGGEPVDGTLAPGQSVCLYQDSNGADTWQRCQGYTGNVAPGGHVFRGKAVTFRGYRVYKRTGEREEVIAKGDHARGTAHLFNGRGGLIVHTRNFWQQFPKATEVAGDGTVRVGLFPRECILPHYLEDASGKGHEVVLHFYSLKNKGPYAADAAGRPLPDAVADAWDYRVYPRPPLAHIAATGALADLGPFTVPVKGFVEVRSRLHGAARMFTADQYWGNGYGWQVYGSRWHSHGGHSRRGARQPIRDDHLLYNWYVIGKRSWLDAGNNRSRQFRDVRAYRIEGQDPFGFKSWALFRRANRSEDYCNRPQPKDDEIKKYSQGFWGRATWWLPNPATMTLDLIYDRYLLFGDVRAFENMNVVAGHGGNYAAYYKPYVHRATGWSWRTLERYWELTGDKDAEQCLMDTLKNYEAMIGKEIPLPKGGGGVNWWFTQVWSRAVAMTALHTGDKRALQLCKTLAPQIPKKQGKYFCTLFSVLYHLTGEEEYREMVLGEGTGESLLRVCSTGDFPAAAHWLVHQPPRVRK